MKTYTERVFGKVDGKDVVAYRFETEAGYQLEIMTYGATILRYVTPDKAGNFANVILGFDDFDSYVGNSPKHGASVGPVAGRIAGATFELNGETYELEVNNASNCNHSGSTGWDSSLFELVEVSDQDTLVNPTNHSYFNLSGDFTQTIDRHVFQLNTEGIYPIAPDGVPAKAPDANRDVVKHIYNGALLKDIFAEEDEQIQLVSGLDHPFALPAGHDNAGFLYDQGSGRFLLFKTEAPCFVVYTANFVDESVIIAGQPMMQHNGIALEAQALPIHSDLKDQVILKAGETFTSKTRYEIVVK